ncbi:phage tail fiber protein, partial [Escherichia coli EC1846]
MEHDEWVK